MLIKVSQRADEAPPCNTVLTHNGGDQAARRRGHGGVPQETPAQVHTVSAAGHLTTSTLALHFSDILPRVQSGGDEDDEDQKEEGCHGYT